MNGMFCFDEVREGCAGPEDERTELNLKSKDVGGYLREVSHVVKRRKLARTNLIALIPLSAHHITHSTLPCCR